MINDLWYKNAIVYCLSVATYMDSDGDGVGDFVGLTRRLDYLQGIGVTALWLMPFQPSPFKDDGYDIADCYGDLPRGLDFRQHPKASVRAKDKTKETDQKVNDAAKPQ